MDADDDGPAWSLPDMRDARYSQSLERGLAILRCFRPGRPLLGIADIADELGMSRSTTHRYVSTLLALGYVEQEASRKYRLGLAVTDLGMSALSSTGLRDHAHPYLRELRDRAGFAISLGVLDGGDVLLVDRLESSRRGHGVHELRLHVGSRLPAYCTAVGKLLLAHLPEAEQRIRLADIKQTKRTAHTITGKQALREELQRVREEGLAVDAEERIADRHAIAVPVRNDAREVVAAVSMAAPSATIALEQLVDALVPHLIATADRISARLGYRREDERASSR